MKLTFQMLNALAIIFLMTPGNSAVADEPKKPTPTAILPFANRGAGHNEASQVADLLLAKLIASEHIALVERQLLNSVFDELKLSKSGVVNADEATRVGKLTGAKLLITGSVLQVKGDLYLIAKIIGTETSRLSGASVKGSVNSDLGELVGQLAVQIDQIVANKVDALLPKAESIEEWLTKQKKQLDGKTLPSITVMIVERHLGQQTFDTAGARTPGSMVPIAERHLGQKTFDPAAQTECERILAELGFKLIAADNANSSRADIRIKGEAFSQFASTHANLVSIQCRVELQVIAQADGNVLTSDAATTIAVDLAEQIAAKSGLQAAARKLIERILPKLVR